MSESNQDNESNKTSNSFDPKVIHGMVKMTKEMAKAKTACLLLETSDGNFHIVGDGAENSGSHVSLLLGATAHVTGRIFSDLTDKAHPEPDQESVITPSH